VIVPAKQLGQWVETASDDIVMSTKENRLNARSGKSKSYFNVIPINTFPEVEFPPNALYIVTLRSAQLRSGLRQAEISATDSDIRVVNNSIFIEALNGKVSFVASDGQRMSVKSIEVPTPTAGNVLIPKKTAALLEKTLASKIGECAIYLSENKVGIKFTGEFTDDEFWFSSLIVNTKFFDYHKLMELYPETCRTEVDTKSLQLAINQAFIFVSEERPVVVLEFHDDFINIGTHDTDTGKIGGNITNVPTGNLVGEKNIVGIYSAVFLKDVLSVVDGSSIIVIGKKYDSGNAIYYPLFIEDGNFTHMLSPVVS